GLAELLGGVADRQITHAWFSPSIACWHMTPTNFRIATKFAVVQDHFDRGVIKNEREDSHEYSQTHIHGVIGCGAGRFVQHDHAGSGAERPGGNLYRAQIVDR
ncbi:MAG: hypothetical protein KIS86_11395, partial [Devosia sp.]|nr:hypothetical protein [Devosia sp.]